MNGAPKMLTYFRLKSPGVGVEIVGCPPQIASDNLFAKSVAGERPQAHDLHDGLCVPPFEELADGDHPLNLTPGSSCRPSVSAICRSRSACCGLVNDLTRASSSSSSPFVAMATACSFDSA